MSKKMSKTGQFIRWLTKKRRRSQNDEPPNKQAKSDSIEPMNMMDLNDDCLDHILKNLKVKYLVNVADTSKRLRQAAQLTFKSKYRERLVVLGATCNGFVCSLKIIRCFGQLISKLELIYDDMSERQSVELDRYLKEHGAPLVTELTLTGRYWTKPTSKIESFTFLSDINKFMPILRVLTLKYCTSIECIEAHITHLEYLEIHVYKRWQGNRAGELASLKTGLRLNPQLKSLYICGFNMDLQLLRIAARECAQLKSLALLGDYAYSGTNTGAEPIQFKNVTKFETSGKFFDAMVSAKASISFDQLDELEIRDGRGKESVIRFLSKYPSISKFYHIDWDYNKEISSEIHRVLPSVTEAAFTGPRFSVDGAIKFVNERKLLKKFVFKLAKPSKYVVLQKLLGKEWQSSIDRDNCVTLER